MSCSEFLKTYQFDRKCRLGPNSDGGYVIGLIDTEYDCYVSCGVSQEEGFSRDFILRYPMNFTNSFAFDGTIDAYPHNYTTDISFIKKNINSFNNRENTTLTDIFSKFNSIFVKMDIEGGEYPWLLDVSTNNLSRISQMVIEFHGINDDTWGTNFKDKMKCLEKLAKTHYIIHAHGNNGEGATNGIPDVIELTFINKSLYTPKLNTRPLPIPNLDFPNRSDRADHNLNFAPFTFKILEDTLISLTSIPRRFNTCLPKVIENLKNQSVQCKIIVNIPLEYEKWKEDVVIPEWLFSHSDVIVYRPVKDYGPATKLIGALEYIKVTNTSNIRYVITVDYDILYSAEHIEKLKAVSNSLPNYAITLAGIKLIKFPYHCNDGLAYHNDGFVDASGGFYGVVYPIKPLQENSHLFEKEFIDSLPSGIRNDDDVFFGIICAIINVPIYACYNSTFLTVWPYDSGESAVEESTQIPRSQNESELFQFAVEMGYLPNKASVLNSS
jgi:hypothetical protein